MSKQEITFVQDHDKGNYDFLVMRREYFALFLCHFLEDSLEGLESSGVDQI